VTAQEQQPVTLEGHTFEPWTDGQSVGFKVTNRDGRVEYVFLCPTTRHRPGVDPEAGITLLSHRGPSEPDKDPGPNPDDDPGLDGPYTGDSMLASFDLFPEE
jgi:hypothetical protein